MPSYAKNFRRPVCSHARNAGTVLQNSFAAADARQIIIITRAI